MMSSTETTTTTTTTRSMSPSVKIDPNYVKTPNGIIRIVQMVLCLITFIMACTVWGGSVVGYIQFASISAFLQALVYFILNLFLPSLPSYKPTGTLIELLISAVWVLLLVIAGIIAAVNAHPFFPIIGAIAAFSFFCAVAYGVGCFFLFKDWRSQGGTIPTVTTGSSSTTTTEPS